MDLIKNEDFGFGVRAKAYHPLAQRFPALRKDQKFVQDVMLAVAPDGSQQFIACSWRDLPRLIHAPAGRSRLWRTLDADEAIAKVIELKAHENRFDPTCEWEINVSLLPDEQTLVKKIQQYGLPREMRASAA